MVVQFAKWGNSIAFRVPSALAREIGAAEGSVAEVAVEDGKLVLTPLVARLRYDLATLVSGIHRENVHGEIDTGAPVGEEIW